MAGYQPRSYHEGSSSSNGLDYIFIGIGVVIGLIFLGAYLIDFTNNKIIGKKKKVIIQKEVIDYENKRYIKNDQILLVILVSIYIVLNIIGLIYFQNNGMKGYWGVAIFLIIVFKIIYTWISVFIAPTKLIEYEDEIRFRK